MLTLPIKKKWFDMIRSGEKTEEYREIKPYYTKRFDKVFRTGQFLQPATICLRNGYSKNSPSINAYCSLRVGYGKPEWGAEKGKKYYVLSIIEKENKH